MDGLLFILSFRKKPRMIGRPHGPGAEIEIK